MKKYILLGLSLMFFNSTIAQTTSEKIETDFVNYTNLIIDKKIDEAIEFSNPKLFEIFTRTQMKSLLEMVYNMPNIEYKMNLPTNIEVGDWILINHGHWSTSMLMEIKGKEEKLWYISPKSYKEGLLAKSSEIPNHLKEYNIK